MAASDLPRAQLTRRGFVTAAGSTGVASLAAVGFGGEAGQAEQAGAQTRLTVERLKRGPLLRRLIRTDGLMIVGGHYNLDTGRIRLIA